jgi:ATP-dependent Lon protease
MNMKSKKLPLLPVRDLVVFPHMVIPLLVGRKKSIEAVDASMKKNRLILLCTQKEASKEAPQEEDIFSIGTLCEIVQLIKLSDGSIKILVEGIKRAKISYYLHKEPYLCVTAEEINTVISKDHKIKALLRIVTSQFEKYIKLNPKTPQEISSSIHNIKDPYKLANIIAGHAPFKIEDRQKLLETIDLKEMLQKLIKLLDAEIEILEIELKIHGQVRKQMETSQKNYYLHEQMKAIQKELGATEDLRAEVEDLRKKIKEARMSKEAEEKAEQELEKLSKMMSSSPEATVLRNYIDWLISVPWYKKTKDNINIKDAKKILDEDHYGLKKVKERILEFLAVHRLVKKMKGPILCFVGPPGVGKTSLAKSIARALNRNFVRVSLGGVRDEAEIRGHRRTYIGSLPGKIIQSMKKAKTKNPVFIMDEVDKMSMDFRGDPSSALLEVLDPEQNSTFNDHYLEVDYDLSDCFFITTANIQHAIPIPLQDRMEIISLPGYTEEEKIKIAELFLISKQLEQNGLDKKNVTFNKNAVIKIINNYTREAGVRNLEREIASVCRKIAKDMVTKKIKKGKKYIITEKGVSKYLGVEKFRYLKPEKNNEIGVVTGLAWTEAGGDIMNVEVSSMKGKGKLMLTGHLGEVMQESAQAALSYIRAQAKKLKINGGFYKNLDLHIHVPEGAIPKDGPSAGITMATAMVSTLTSKAVKKDMAMTGEITLRGKVLPIGGLKSKVLAARRNNILNIIIPEENKKDLEEISPLIRKSIKFIFVKTIDEVLKHALMKKVRSPKS